MHSRFLLPSLPSVRRLLAALAGLCAASLARADLVVYSSFNNLLDPLTPDIGSANVVLTEIGVGTSFTFASTGTTVNVQPGYPAGYSVGDFDLLTVFSALILDYNDLDFSGFSNVTLSFASSSSELFTAANAFTLQYSLDGGSTYSAPFDLAPPDSSWTTRVINFENLLDDQSDVSVRLSINQFLSAVATTGFDNVTFIATPVPEPGAAGALAGAGALVAAWATRRRAVRA